MPTAEARTDKSSPPTRRPTEYLLRNDMDQLSSVMVYRLTIKGFALKDVQDMLSLSDLFSKPPRSTLFPYTTLSDLFSNKKIMSRIVGKSIRTLQRQGTRQPALLNAQQSAVAFQYAKVLEHAITVFGTQKLAEEWLGRPCKYLDGDVPLDVIDNPVGFQAVEDYLERVEYGVYQ